MPRLSIQIHKLKEQKARAQSIADWIRQDRNNWYKLKPKDQTLWAGYHNGDLDRQICELKSQQQAKFPGAA